MKVYIPSLLRLLVLVLLFFLSTPTFSQSPKLMDSIKNVLRTTIFDSVKYRGYADLSWQYANTRTKLDSAQMYADSIKILAESKHDEKGIALSNYYYGLVKRFEGDFYTGIKHFELTSSYYANMGDEKKMAPILYNIAVMYSNIGEYEASLANYQKALDIYVKTNQPHSVANMQLAMGHVQRRIDGNKAIRSYENAIKTFEKVSDSTGLSMAIESRGTTFRELGEYDKAKADLLHALQIVREEKRPYGIASVTKNLGDFYSVLNDDEQAIGYYKQSYSIRKKLPSKKNLVIGLNDLGLTYAKLGNYKISKEYLDEARQLADSISIRGLQKDNFAAQTQLYEYQEQYEKAFEFQKLLIQTKDYIFDEEKNKQLVEMETKYDVKQKEQEIQLLAKENELQLARTEKESAIKNGLLGSILLMVIIAGLLFYTLRQRLKNQSILAKKNEELRFSQFREQLSTLEMKALRAQMNPHFLFNCMNSINRMILGNQNDEASSYLAKFSKLVRAMLENSEQPQVSLKQELQLLKSYIQLESIRFKNRIDAEVIVAENIDQDNTYIPSMLLQPFIENAIWHGLMHKKGKGKISLKIVEGEDMLHCKITDNGVGRKKSMELQKENRNDKKSMGIKITSNRLAMLSKKKIDELVQIIDLKDGDNNALGTKVQISIPII